MLRMTLLAVSAVLLTAQVASAAEPIEGDWMTLKHTTAHIAPCQGDKFCITLQDGEHAGMQIGVLKGGGGQYVGQVTDPESNKTYDGSATVTGKSMKLQGCMMKIFCKSQVWTRK